MSEREKAVQFVSRLKSNPALQGLNPLQQEEQLKQFLRINGSQLQPTLSSPAFFNGMEWSQIISLLTETIQDSATEVLLQDIDKILANQIKYNFLGSFEKKVSCEQIVPILKKLIHRILENNLSRRAFSVSYTAVKSAIVPKYLKSSMDRQKYISFELRKVQRLKLADHKDAVGYIYVNLLLKPIVYLYAGVDDDLAQTKSGLVLNNYAKNVLSKLVAEYPGLPVDIFKSSINSSISFQENNKTEATARAAAIMYGRCEQYNPNIKVDRGAETPDKSWFSVARKNYKFNGLDHDMLSEFYNISTENWW